MNKQMKRWLNRPIFTYTFLAIQTLVFIIGYISPMTQVMGVMFGPYVAYMNEYWRFVTPIFIHFGLAHFAVNSVILYFMGQQVEAIYGHARFFILYLMSGVMGNAMSFAFNQAGVQSAGASTSLFGLFGAFLILGLHFKNDYQIQAMVRQFALFVVLNFVFGLFDQSIDIWGHLRQCIGFTKELREIFDSYPHSCRHCFSFFTGSFCDIWFKKVSNTCIISRKCVYGNVI